MKVNTQQIKFIKYLFYNIRIKYKSLTEEEICLTLTTVFLSSNVYVSEKEK